MVWRGTHQGPVRRNHQLPSMESVWAALPGVREGYHVHMPMFCTMFERLLSAPRPWLFVQLYIPGGVKNSWEPEYALTPLQAESGEPT